MITVDADIGSSIDRTHCALVSSCKFSFAPALRESSDLFTQDWEHLELDPYMADGGKYRSRRYGQYQLSATTGQLTHVPGASFYQRIETNPLNGGKPRHFAPLDAGTVNNAFLSELILFDFAQLTSHKHVVNDWLVGVHQIRIRATDGTPGNPTPEGIHRDDEDYTVQHLISRQHIGEGINYFYGTGSEPTENPQIVWQQQSYFDSFYFDHWQWHSVSQIISDDHNGDGHRDILLIDFVASSRTTVTA